MNILTVRYKNPPKHKYSYKPVCDKYIYHASPVNNLTVIKPKAKTIRHKGEGPVIFATPDIAYASMFLFSYDSSWVLSGLYNHVHFMIIGDEKRFRKLDCGGTIYKLPCEDFSCDLTKQGREKEWVSKNNVPVKGNEYYPSVLEAMIDYWVQIYFVDRPTFRKIANGGKVNFSYLKNFQSENEKVGINRKKLIA